MELAKKYDRESILIGIGYGIFSLIHVSKYQKAVDEAKKRGEL